MGIEVIMLSEKSQTQKMHMHCPTNWWDPLEVENRLGYQRRDGEKLTDGCWSQKSWCPVALSGDIDDDSVMCIL